MRIRVLEGPDALAEFAAATIARLLREAGERATLGLAGGSTPRTTYTRLVNEDVDWSRIHAWMSDERWVAPDHPDSNLRMIRDALLDSVPAHVYPVPWSSDMAAPEAADRYEQLLMEVLPEGAGGLEPDLVLLGIGEDGHTASLFPGTEALDVEDRWYVANWVPAKEAWRLTATLPLLRAARHVLFLVSGQRKATVLAKILEDDDRPAPPARLVLEGGGDITWLVDRAAASELRTTALEYV